MIESKNENESVEHMIILLQIAGKNTDLAVINKPPNLSKKAFLDELDRLITDNFMSQN